MFCQSLALGLLGSRVAYALKEPYTLVYMGVIPGICVIYIDKKGSAMKT